MKRVTGYAIKDDTDVYMASTDADLIYDSFIDFTKDEFDCVFDDDTIEEGRKAFKEHMKDGGEFWSFDADDGWDFMGIEEIELAELGIQAIAILKK